MHSSHLVSVYSLSAPSFAKSDPRCRSIVFTSLHPKFMLLILYSLSVQSMNMFGRSPGLLSSFITRMHPAALTSFSSSLGVTITDRCFRDTGLSASLCASRTPSWHFANLSTRSGSDSSPKCSSGWLSGRRCLHAWNAASCTACDASSQGSCAFRAAARSSSFCSIEIAANVPMFHSVEFAAIVMLG